MPEGTSSKATPSSFQMNTKNDHPGSDPVKHIGIFQILVAAMNVFKTIADLDLGR